MFYSSWVEMHTAIAQKDSSKFVIESVSIIKIYK